MRKAVGWLFDEAMREEDVSVDLFGLFVTRQKKARKRSDGVVSDRSFSQRDQHSSNRSKFRVTNIVRDKVIQKAPMLLLEGKLGR